MQIDQLGIPVQYWKTDKGWIGVPSGAKKVTLAKPLGSSGRGAPQRGGVGMVNK